MIAVLPIGHFLRHIQQQLAIFLIRLAQQATKLVEVACLFAGAAPRDVVRRPALGEIRQLGRLLAVIEELIEWAFESARQFFQRFNGGDSMAIFNTGNVTTQKSGALLDITLGEFLFFAQSAKTVTDNHELSMSQLVRGSK